MRLEYYGAPRPIVFPVEELLPETKRHLKLRTMLLAIFEEAMSDRATFGSDQFVYWRASEPRACLAPDLFVRLGAPDHDFDIWKTWERGAPHLAVEIASDSDAPDVAWNIKLRRYLDLGVEELVRFDPDLEVGQRIRVWDRVDGDLVERVIKTDATPSRVLGLWWVVRPAWGFPVALRLATDPEGRELLLTPTEAESTARENEARARSVAERELAALRAELERLREGREGG